MFNLSLPAGPSAPPRTPGGTAPQPSTSSWFKAKAAAHFSLFAAGPEEQPFSAGGFAAWSPKAPLRVTMPRLLFCLVAFVAVLFSASLIVFVDAVKGMSRLSSPPVSSGRSAYLEPMEPAVLCSVKSMECKPMSLSIVPEPLQERVIGAYSLPQSLRDNLRFAQDADGRLVLRIWDNPNSQWRDATVDDMSPPTFDVAEIRARARAHAYTARAYSSVSQAERTILREGTPAFVDPSKRPQFSTMRVQTQANFFVTDGLPQIQNAPLLDWIETGGDYWKLHAKEVGRRYRTLERG